MRTSALNKKVILTQRRTKLILIIHHSNFNYFATGTYFRYIPRFSEGITLFKGLKSEIEKENWPAVEKLFEVYVTKYNPNDAGQVDASDFYVNFHFYKPMVSNCFCFFEITYI